MELTIRRWPRARAAVSTVRVGAAVLLALVLLPISAGPVVAATRTFRDPDDSHTIDIRRVRVAYDDWLRVRVRYEGSVVVGQLYELWVDTRPGNPGPEYYFAFNPFAEVGSLQRVSGFGDATKVATDCQKVDGGVNEAHSRVGFDILGRCVGNPSHVRVSIHFVRPSGRSADWAPGVRAFYPRTNRF